MAERNARWTAPGGLARVSLGGTQVPERVVLDGQGLKGAPDLHVEFEIRDGAPDVTTFGLAAKASGRGISTADLRAFHSLDTLAYNAFMRFATRPDETGASTWPIEDERSWWAARADIEDAATDRARASRAELEDVARVYRENLHDRPTEAVQNVLGYSSRTASRRVQQARAAGLLPPTTRGKRRA